MERSEPRQVILLGPLTLSSSKGERTGPSVTTTHGSTGSPRAVRGTHLSQAACQRTGEEEERETR